MSNNTRHLSSAIYSVSKSIILITIFYESVDTKNVISMLKKGAIELNESIDFYVKRTEKGAGLWKKIGFGHVGEEMIEVTATLRDAMVSCVSICKKLVQSPNVRDIKDELKDCLKQICVALFKIYQLYHLYDVLANIKHFQMIEDQLSHIHSPLFPVQDFLASLQRLEVVLEKRAGRIIWIEIKDMLFDVQKDLRKWIIPFTNIFESIKTDDAEQKKIQMLEQALKGIVNKAVFILKLSAKTPFDLHLIDPSLPNWDFGELPFVSSINNVFYRLKDACREENEELFYKNIRNLERLINEKLKESSEFMTNIADPYIKSKKLIELDLAQNKLSLLLQKIEDYDTLINGINQLDVISEEVQRVTASLLHEKIAEDIILSVNIVIQAVESIAQSNRRDYQDSINDIILEVATLNEWIKSFNMSIENDPARKDRIMHNLTELDNYSVELLESTQDVLQVLPSIKDACKEIILDTRFSSIQKLLSQGASVHNHLILLTVQVENNNIQSLTPTLTAIIHLTKPFLQTTESIAINIDNAEVEEGLVQNSRLMKKSLESLISSIRVHLPAPTQTSQQQILGSLKNAQTIIAEIMALSRIDIQEELQICEGKIILAAKAMKISILESDNETTASSIVTLKSARDKQALIYSIAAKRSDDLNVKNRLLNASQEMSLETTESILDNFKLLLSDRIHKKSAIDAIEKYFSNILSTNKEISILLDTTDTKMEDNAINIKFLVAQLLSEIKNDQKENISDKMRLLKERVDIHMVFSRQHSELGNVELKSDIEEGIINITTSLKQLTRSVVLYFKGEGQLNDVEQKSQLLINLSVNLIEISQHKNTRSLKNDCPDFDIIVFTRPMAIEELHLLAQQLKDISSSHATEDEEFSSLLEICNNIGTELGSISILLERRASSEEFLTKLQELSASLDTFHQITTSISESKSESLSEEIINFSDILLVHFTQFTMVSTLFLDDILSFGETHIQSLHHCARNMTTTIASLTSLIHTQKKIRS